MKKILVAIAPVMALAATASVVRIEGKEGSWRLTRDGKEYFIRGGGGGGFGVFIR